MTMLSHSSSFLILVEAYLAELALNSVLVQTAIADREAGNASAPESRVALRAGQVRLRALLASARDLRSPR